MRLSRRGRRLWLPACITIVAAGLWVAFGIRPAAPVATHIAPTPSATGAPASPVVAGSQTQLPEPAVTPAVPTGQPGAPAGRPASAAPPTPASTPAATSVPAPMIKLAVSSPEGQFSYALPASEVTNACDALTAAKNHGYLRSVTLDNSYQSTLHSAYVREINGYENNWTFKVNGSAPRGCSLALVTKGDTVSWSYQ